MKVAVLGLGEAGGRIAADLAATGCTVCGFDPAQRPTGITNADSAPSATVALDHTSPMTNAVVNATAAAADPDGDALSYTWSEGSSQTPPRR